MFSRPLILVSAAVAVAALGACSAGDESRQVQEAAPAPPTTPDATRVDPGPLPPPDVLAEVMYRLADPTVPGPAKLPLVQDTAPPDAAALDGFSAALRDGDFLPITVTATDVRWSSEHPGDAVATVTIAPADAGKPGGFSFPMEFRRNGPGWQLTRETADMLLTFGDARTQPVAPPP